MKTLYVLLLYGMLHVSLVLADTTGLMWTSMEEVFGPYRSTLTHRVGQSPLVVVGTVTDKQSLWRDNGPKTDFTIEVHAIIKGIPNAGKDTVKFMVHGGEAIDPRNGRQVTIGLEYDYEIEIGDQALFFFSQMYKHTAAYKAHPYQGLYLHPKNKVPIDNNTVRLPVLGGNRKVLLPVNLIVALGKASVIDRETAMLIEKAIAFFLIKSDLGETELPADLIERVIFTSENLLRGYKEGVEIAMRGVKRGSRSRVTRTSQTAAEEKGYCRGFVDTIKHHFDVDYYCICDRHWSYQIKRPGK